MNAIVETVRIKKFVVMVGVALAVVVMGGEGKGFADEIKYLSSPCRLLDTRLVGSGAKAPANTTYDISTRGTPGGSQGGQTGCGLPEHATSAVLSLIAISPEANGNIKLYAAGTSAPLSTALNVNYFSGSTNNRNDSMLVKLPNTGTGYDLVALPTMNTHLVIDLVGWTETVPTMTFMGNVISNQDTGGGIHGIWVTGQPLIIVCGPPLDPVFCSEDSLPNGIGVWGTGYIDTDGTTVIAARIEALPED